MTSPRKINVGRMRKRVHVAELSAAKTSEDEVEPKIIRDLSGEVIRVIYPS